MTAGPGLAARRDPAVSSLTVRESEEAAGTAFVECEFEEFAIGGGGITDAFLYESLPDPPEGIPFGWSASAKAADAADANVTAYVICAAP